MMIQYNQIQSLPFVACLKIYIYHSTNPTIINPRFNQFSSQFFSQVAVLLLAALAVAEPEADAQYLLGYGYASPHATAGLTTYANGAVVPTDTLSVQAAKAQHFAAKAAYAPYAYGAYPYAYGAYGAHLIGKREAEPEADAQYFYGSPYIAGPHTSLGLTAYANGAVAPTKTYAVQVAEAQHFAAKAAATPYVYGAYPYAYGAHYIGKRDAEPKADADAQYLAYGYSGYPYATYGAYAGAYAGAYPAAYPSVYGARYLGKREAEPTAEPTADAQFIASAYRYPYATYGAYAGVPAVSTAYTTYGAYGYPYGGLSYYG
jgi:hypothetical protein